MGLRDYDAIHTTLLFFTTWEVFGLPVQVGTTEWIGGIFFCSDVCYCLFLCGYFYLNMLRYIIDKHTIFFTERNKKNGESL